jgi:hypothetical protein
LTEVPAAGLARQAEGAHRLLAGEAAGGVGQVGEALGIEEVGQHGRVGSLMFTRRSATVTISAPAASAAAAFWA